MSSSSHHVSKRLLVGFLDFEVAFGVEMGRLSQPYSVEQVEKAGLWFQFLQLSLSRVEGEEHILVTHLPLMLKHSHRKASLACARGSSTFLNIEADNLKCAGLEISW